MNCALPRTLAGGEVRTAENFPPHAAGACTAETFGSALETFGSPLRLAVLCLERAGENDLETLSRSHALDLAAACDDWKARAEARMILSARKLARALDVPHNRISELVAGRRSMTADTALRLERYFGMEARFWLNLQAAHDLSAARESHSYKQIKPREAA